MDKSTENRVLEKLLSFLTHQWVTISDTMANSTDSWSMSTRNSDVVDEDHHWGTMKLGMSAKLYAFVKNIQQKLACSSTSWPCKSSILFFKKWFFWFQHFFLCEFFFSFGIFIYFWKMWCTLQYYVIENKWDCLCNSNDSVFGF